MANETIGRWALEGVKDFWKLYRRLGTHLLFAFCSNLKMQIDHFRIGYELRDRSAWIGWYWDAPDLLVFRTQKIEFQIAVANSIGYGEVVDDPEVPDAYTWTLHLDLMDSKDGFFQTRGREQFQLIEQFVDRCREALDKLEYSPWPP